MPKEQARAISIAVRKDLSFEIADARKEAATRFEKNEAQMLACFEKSDVQIALLRKDVESISTWLLMNMVACEGVQYSVSG